MDVKNLCLRLANARAHSHEGAAVPAGCVAHTALAALVESHRLGAHQIEVGAYAGPPCIGRDYAAGITETSLDG